MQGIAYIFRKSTWALAIVAALLLAYDLVNGWIASARFHVRTVQELWTTLSPAGFEKAQSALRLRLSPKALDFLLHLPAPAGLLLLAAFTYIVFRILFYLGRGDNHSLL